MDFSRLHWLAETAIQVAKEEEEALQKQRNSVSNEINGNANNTNTSKKSTTRKRKNSNGKRAETINGNEDNNDVNLDEQPVPKKRPRKRQEESSASQTIPDLSQEFRNKIAQMGGEEITLVIQKVLQESDLSKQQNRLSMPFKQLKNIGFLRRKELEILDNKDTIEVLVIQPISLQITTLLFGKWILNKDSGKASTSYILRTPWMKFAENNQLKVDNVVQVWSFRAQDQLGLALVKI